MRYRGPFLINNHQHMQVFYCNSLLRSPAKAGGLHLLVATGSFNFCYKPSKTLVKFSRSNSIFVFKRKRGTKVLVV